MPAPMVGRRSRALNILRAPRVAVYVSRPVPRASGQECAGRTETLVTPVPAGAGFPARRRWEVGLGRPPDALGAGGHTSPRAVFDSGCSDLGQWVALTSPTVGTGGRRLSNVTTRLGRGRSRSSEARA